MALKSKIYATAAFYALTLTACGGGSGSSTSGTPNSSAPPADTAAPNVSFNPTTLTVESNMIGTSTLTTTDNVGITTGPTITCTNAGSFSGSTFTAPIITVDTISECTATAGDAAGNSASATLTVTIIAPNVAPVASATANPVAISGGQPFVLDASGSTDANGDNLTYNWVQTSGTVVTIETATDAVQNLMAPDITTNETLEFEVTVSDGELSSTANVSIDIEAINVRPVASALSNIIIVTEGQPFVLDASGSTDVNGDNLTYNWVQTSGTAVTI